MPSAARIALLVNPANPVPAETMAKDTEVAAETIGRHIDVYQAETSREIEMAFAALVRDRADALLVGAEPFFIDRRVQIVTSRRVICFQPSTFCANLPKSVGS